MIGKVSESLESIIVRRWRNWYFSRKEVIVDVGDGKKYPDGSQPKEMRGTEGRVCSLQGALHWEYATDMWV